MLTEGYRWFYTWCGGDELLITVLGSLVFMAIAFWSFNAFFLTIDFLKPKWAQPYKVQDGSKVSFSRFLGALPLILFNEFVVSPPLAVLAYYIGRHTGVTFSLDLPSPLTVLYHIAICIVVEEIGFYYTHRLFHHPAIYKHVHKIHHRWTAPIGVTAIYAHPLEHAVSNVMPVLLGPLLCGSHIVTAWLWYTLALFSTTCSHSGYHFPLMPSPESHDYHHFAFNECFGVMGWLDWLHETDKTFRASANYKRHHTSFTRTPLKVLFPKEKKEQ